MSTASSHLFFVSYSLLLFVLFFCFSCWSRILFCSGIFFILGTVVVVFFYFFFLICKHKILLLCCGKQVNR